MAKWRRIIIWGEVLQIQKVDLWTRAFATDANLRCSLHKEAGLWTQRVKIVVFLSLNYLVSTLLNDNHYKEVVILGLFTIIPFNTLEFERLCT